MIPKYSNPSILLNSTTIVSRAALHGDSDDETEHVHPATDPEQAQMVARLENILKRSIADVLPHSNDEEYGERSRKKKKRNHDSRQLKESQQVGVSEGEVAVPFRLLSGVSQPQPIILGPRTQPTSSSRGPALEDTDAEAERRAARARQIAVDFAWVMAEASKPVMATPKLKKEIHHVSAKLPNPTGPLLVLERPKLAPKPPRLSHSHPEVEAEPSPHEHCTECCPIIEVQPLSPNAAGVDSPKRKRRRGRPREKPVIQPTFWRPPPALGGKSLGYAWGYPGSRPLQPDETPCYLRDTMKRAVHG